QEFIHSYRQGGAAAARQSPHGAQRHSGGEPSGRVVEPVRVSQSGDAGRGQGAENGRRTGPESQPGGPAVIGTRAASVHSAAHQTTGRAGVAGEDGADYFLRAGRPAAEAIGRSETALPG